MHDSDMEMSRWSIGELLAAVAQADGPRPDLVERAGSLSALARADAFELAAWLERRDPDATERPSRAARPTRALMGRARALGAAFELGRRAEIARAGPVDRLGSAAEVAAWAMPRLASLAHEELWLLALDGRGHLRAARCVARGGLHGAAVAAADPLRAALRADASAFVLVHNHPSGEPTPSREDAALTSRVAEAARIVGVPLLDHVVIARGGFASVPTEEAEGRRPPSGPVSVALGGSGR